jgi:hypothetical protein
MEHHYPDQTDPLADEETFHMPDGGSSTIEDTDGDGDLEVVSSDFDGDGDSEIVQYDADGDGSLESVDFDI